MDKITKEDFDLYTEDNYDQEGYDFEYEEVDRVCPECKGRLISFCEPNGKDDYIKVDECTRCGERWSN